ncbi:MAG: hypothetical protein QMC67_00205 [Candidatus Wallbacteria bacterium]
MQNQDPRPNKTIGLIVSALFLCYAAYSFYWVFKIMTSYNERAAGTIKKVQGSFVPGNHIYVSQFNNYVDYEFRDNSGKIITGTVNSLMLSFSKAGDEISIHYKKDSPERDNIPVNGIYGYFISFATLALIGGLLLNFSLKLA